jgi:hypothetical protein
MPYYGDPGYYRGDYYMGDPSFLSGLGKVFKTVGRVVGGAAIGFLSGGPKGAIVGAVGGTGAALRENVSSETLSAGENATALTPELRAAHANALARRTSPPGGGGTAMMAMPGMPGTFARGYRLNKTTYVVRGGGTSRWPVGIQVIPKHTVAVKSRRMNVANPRALRRSLRRVAGFAKTVKRVRSAVSRAASADGVHRGGKKKSVARAPSVRVVRG